MKYVIMSLNNDLLERFANNSKIICISFIYTFYIVEKIINTRCSKQNKYTSQILITIISVLR